MRGRSTLTDGGIQPPSKTQRSGDKELAKNKKIQRRGQTARLATGALCARPPAGGWVERPDARPVTGQMSAPCPDDGIEGQQTARLATGALCAAPQAGGLGDFALIREKSSRRDTTPPETWQYMF